MNNLKTLSSVEHLKNLKYLLLSCKTKDFMCYFSIFRVHLEIFTAKYNWKYVFTLLKTNKEAQNAISLMKCSA